MSTTTIGDLLDRAESLARSLRATRTETTTDQWRSFDSVAYRVLHELVGPERVRSTRRVCATASRSSRTRP